MVERLSVLEYYENEIKDRSSSYSKEQLEKWKNRIKVENKISKIIEKNIQKINIIGKEKFENFFFFNTTDEKHLVVGNSWDRQYRFTYPFGFYDDTGLSYHYQKIVNSGDIQSKVRMSISISGDLNDIIIHGRKVDLSIRFEADYLKDEIVKFSFNTPESLDYEFNNVLIQFRTYIENLKKELDRRNQNASSWN
jgi:hypothetical protein